MVQSYITDVSDKFDQEQAQIKTGTPEVGIKSKRSEAEIEEAFFDGAMSGLVEYLYERKREYLDDSDDEAASLDLLFDPENVENIYVTQYPYEPTTVVVEYAEVPEWFTMENAALREFEWWPHPAHSQEVTAAYFQPRSA